MSFTIKASVSGVPDLFAALRAIDKKIARKEMRAAVNESGKAVLKTAKQNAPVDSGALKASLGLKVHASRDGARISAIVGPRKLRGTVGKGAKRKKNQLSAFGKSKAGQKALAAGLDPVRYAHLVEFGTRPHSLGKGDRVARKDKRRRVLARRSVGASKHPGARPKPFLRPALDRNIGAVRAIMRMRLEAALRNAGVA